MTIRNLFATAMVALVCTALFACAETAKKESTGQYVDNTAITAQVKAAFLQEPTLKSAEINVESYKGTVQLSGFVRSRANIKTAVKLARAVPGVVEVKNDMQLR